MNLRNLEFSMIEKSFLQFWLVLLLVTVAAKTMAQETAPTQQNFTGVSKDLADDNQYVSLYYTSGGKLQKHFYCFKYKGYQIINVNIGDSLHGAVVIEKPEIFKYLQANKKFIIAVKNHSPKLYSKKVFKDDFKNPDINFFQVGIRINGLHFNHFQRTTPEFIATLKRDKLKQGCAVINNVIDIIEKSTSRIMPEQEQN